MLANFVEVVPHHDEFRDAVGKYNVSSRLLGLGLGFGLVLGVAYIIKCRV